MKSMHTRKGVSPIIATVLLVILTLVAVSILAVFVIRFVNDSVKGSDECFKVLGKVKFDDTLYNCNFANASMARTGFSVRIDSDQALGIKVAFTKAGSTNSFSIENGTSMETIRMLNGNFNTPLEVPARGGVRTYVTNDNYDRVEISAILKSGMVCDTRETVTISPCSDPSVVSKITEH